MNEAPVISTLDGNDTGIIDHVENLTDVIDVNVTHEENATQSVSFLIIGGADQAQFDINSSTGQLVPATHPCSPHVAAGRSLLFPSSSLAHS